MAIDQALSYFSKRARVAVANGPTFNTQRKGFYVREDGRCIIAALLFEDKKSDDTIAGGTYAARMFGFDPENRDHRKIIAQFNELGNNNDSGKYAKRENLRSDLLGGA